MKGMKPLDNNRYNSSQNCTHDCSSCSMNCPSRSGGIAKEELNQQSSVKHVIAVVSGKGGVGKSLVTSLLATVMRRREFGVAILDADITGPSIPKAFGAKGDIIQSGGGLMPLESTTGIQLISVNLLLEDENAPVVWRGPVISGMIKQFWTDIIWSDVDWMFIDMPPGTGDVPLTVFQSLPVDGIIVVTTPQDLVSMIVKKAVNMAKMMNIPILGFVENMSGVICPDCGKRIDVFGKSKVDDLSKEFGVPVLGRIPLDSHLTALCDKGLVELFNGDWLDGAADQLIEKFR